MGSKQVLPLRAKVDMEVIAKKGMPHCLKLQDSNLTIRCSLVSYLGHSLGEGGSYHFEEMQLVYSTGLNTNDLRILEWFQVFLLNRNNYMISNNYFYLIDEICFHTVIWLVSWFYGISTIVGYLMPNPVYKNIIDIYDL